MTSTTKLSTGIHHSSFPTTYPSRSPAPNAGRKLPQPPPQHKPTHPTKQLANLVTPTPTGPCPTIHKTQAKSIAALGIENAKQESIKSFYDNYPLQVSPATLYSEVSKSFEDLLLSVIRYRNIVSTSKVTKDLSDEYSAIFGDQINKIRSLINSCDPTPEALSEHEYNKILCQILIFLDKDYDLNEATDTLTMSLVVALEAVTSFYLYSTNNNLALNNHASSSLLFELICKFINKHKSNPFFIKLADMYGSDVVTMKNLYSERESGKKLPSLAYFINPCLWKIFSTWGIHERDVCDGLESTFYYYQFDEFYANFLIRNFVGGLLATHIGANSEDESYDLQCVDKFERLFLDAYIHQASDVFYSKAIRTFAIYAKNSSNKQVLSKFLLVLGKFSSMSFSEEIKMQIEHAKLLMITAQPHLKVFNLGKIGDTNKNTIIIVKSDT